MLLESIIGWSEILEQISTLEEYVIECCGAHEHEAFNLGRWLTVVVAGKRDGMQFRAPNTKHPPITLLGRHTKGKTL